MITVYEVFEDVASSYDKMNDAMSLGIHRIWKDIFVNRLAPTANSRILDVAGGTGMHMTYLMLEINSNINKLFINR